MTTAAYETTVRLAGRPVVNLFTNPRAETSLANVSNTNCTIARQSPFSGPGSTTAIRVNASASSASWINIGGDVGGIRLGLVPGKTYVASGTLYLDAALTGSVDALARRIVAYTRIGTGAYVTTQSSAAANAAGASTRVSVTFTVPATASEAFLRLFHGHTGGSLYWHSLRLSESTGNLAADSAPLDGSMVAPATLGSDEYGWDRAVGESTSWKIPGALDVELVDAEIDELSVDRKRVPFIEATITAPYPGDAVWSKLDPRVARDVILRFNVKHRADPAAPAVLSQLPFEGSSDGRGKLWLREAELDEISGTITLRASSGEVRFEDKKRLSGAVLDTGAPDAGELFRFAAIDVGEAAAIDYVDDDAWNSAVPAGDRRLWLQGESASSVFEAELAAAEYPTRAYCDETGLFSVRKITEPPGYLSAPAFALASGNAGTIISARSALTRDGWADAVMVKASYANGAGATVTQYQIEPTTGVNRAGVVRTIERAISGSRVAAAYAGEIGKAGARETVVAMCDFGARPGRRVNVTLATGRAYSIDPDRVTYRIREGQMTIEGIRV